MKHLQLSQRLSTSDMDLAPVHALVQCKSTPAAPCTTSCEQKPCSCCPPLKIASCPMPQPECSTKNCCCKKPVPNPKCKAKNCCWKKQATSLEVKKCNGKSDGCSSSSSRAVRTRISNDLVARLLSHLFKAAFLAMV